jgi:hypothetical protein
MIIVKCIKPSNGLILNQCYEVNDIAFGDNTMNIRVSSLEGNYISDQWYSVYYFETIEENRNNKLNKLGI